MKYPIVRLLCSLLVAVKSMSAHAALSDIGRIFHQNPNIELFEVCQGGGCATVSQASLSVTEWDNILRVFSPMPQTAEQEREKISLAIGVLEDIVGVKVGTTADKAGTFGNSEYQGQLDCNDEAINTTTYMRLLKSHGLLKYHDIEDMRTRNFFFTGWPHTTAVIHDIKTGERFAVDSWFYDNGKPATIVTFAKWKANFRPEDSPIGKAKTSAPASAQTAHSSGAAEGGH